MKNIYACLLGQWFNLSADTTCIIDNTANPNVWWEEYGANMFKYDYVNITYKGKNYRIHPTFIQVVTE